MLRIRLQRKGRKKRPIYHLVVADSRSPRDGRIIEQVGRYDNVTENKEVVLNEDRILYWLETGAQPSDTVRKILRNEGLLYKRHLMMWGKSEEEIEAALAEWKSYRESKATSEASRKDTYKAVLAAEEKEFKNQVEKKASKAAAELEQEAVAEESTEEAEASATEKVAEDTAAEETSPEVAEAEEAVEEVVQEEETAEAEEEAVAETVEEPATEEPAAEEETAETQEETTEEVTEEPVEETEAVVEEAPAEEEKAEEPVAEASTQTSDALTAKEAIDHIKNTDLAALEGFVTGDESRKTVLAAWESKQAEG